MTAFPLSALPFETPRLRIRRFSPNDAARYLTYRFDLEVGRFQGWRTKCVEEVPAFLREQGEVERPLAGQWFQSAVADRGSDLLQGDIGLCMNDLEDGRVSFSLAYTFARDAQGRGLATEAASAVIELLFTDPAVCRIEAGCDAANHAGARLLLRLGFIESDSEASVLHGRASVERKFVLQRPTQAVHST